MPVQHISSMDTMEGEGPTIDAYNRINNLAAVLKVATKTADYTCKIEESGTVFDTTGAAGAVTFTLPAETNAGVFYIFKNTVGQNMVITAPANKLVAFNSATSTSATYSTAGNLIGAAALVVCDGAKWHLMSFNANTVTLS